MNYETLKQQLFEMRDLKFASFSKSLLNSSYEVIGIKNPLLKDLINQYKSDSELILSEFELGIYYEIDFLYFGLSLKRCHTINEQLNFLEQEIAKADSWAITDTMCSLLKKVTVDDFWPFFFACYKDEGIYKRRIAYVLGLKVYKEKDILKVLDYLSENEEYMVMMAEAWLLATMAICYPKEIYEYLKKLNDYTLVRKTISKICDSRRIDDDTKQLFKVLRKS